MMYNTKSQHATTKSICIIGWNIAVEIENTLMHPQKSCYKWIIFLRYTMYSRGKIQYHIKSWYWFFWIKTSNIISKSKIQKKTVSDHRCYRGLKWDQHVLLKWNYRNSLPVFRNLTYALQHLLVHVGIEI